MSCYVLLPPAGKPVMIITEYMENGSLDTFLKVRWQQEVGKRLPGNQIFFFSVVVNRWSLWTHPVFLLNSQPNVFYKNSNSSSLSIMSSK